MLLIGDLGPEFGSRGGGTPQTSSTGCERSQVPVIPYGHGAGLLRQKVMENRGSRLARCPRGAGLSSPGEKTEKLGTGEVRSPQGLMGEGSRKIRESKGAFGTSGHAAPRVKNRGMIGGDILRKEFPCRPRQNLKTPRRTNDDYRYSSAFEKRRQ